MNFLRDNARILVPLLLGLGVFIGVGWFAKDQPWLVGFFAGAGIGIAAYRRKTLIR